MRFYVHRTNTINTRYEESELFDTEINILIKIYKKQLENKIFEKHQYLLTQKITTLIEEQQMRTKLLTKINFKNQQKREIGHTIRLTEKEAGYIKIIETEQDYYSRNNSSIAIL